MDYCGPTGVSGWKYIYIYFYKKGGLGRLVGYGCCACGPGVLKGRSGLGKVEKGGFVPRVMIKRAKGGGAWDDRTERWMGHGRPGAEGV